MRLLTEEQERTTLYKMLSNLPGIDNAPVRRSLLAGLPDALRHNLQFGAATGEFIVGLIDAADGEAFGQLADGSWTLIKVIGNAELLVRGFQLGDQLATTRSVLEGRVVKIERKAAEPPAQAAAAANAAGRATGADGGEADLLLQEALLSAFPTRNDLERMVRFGLNKPLNYIAGDGDPMPTVVLRLVDWAKADGLIEALVVAARKANPGAAGLREFAEKSGLAATSPPALPATEAKPDVGAAPSIDVYSWNAGMTEAETTVCRVELDNGRGYCTGFLLGPSAVMIPCHMAPKAFGDPSQTPGLKLRFDYRWLQDGSVHQGRVYGLAKEKCVIASSPVDKLDFALLRVDGRPGDDPAGGLRGAPPRRWLRPTQKYAFPEDDPLFMIQHPSARPLKWEFERNAVGKVHSGGTRVTYRINTEPGSGGAPCFNVNWELVAMHRGRAAPREAAGAGEWKEGVPIAAIVADPKVQAALGT